MLRLRAATLLAAFALSGCVGATVPTSSVPKSSVQPTTTPSVPPTPGSPATAMPSAAQSTATNRPTLEGPIVYEQGARLGIVESDGTRSRALLPSSFPGELLAVDWSTDGHKLVFYQLVPGVESGIYETDVSGSTPHRLDLSCERSEGQAGCLEDDWPAYSPDGLRLAVVRWKGIFDPINEPPPTSTVVVIIDLATGQQTELASTELPFGSGAAAGENVKPRWSPDGTHLVFHRVHFDDEFLPVDSELLVVNADDSDLQRITPTDMTAGDADWSPDGSLIVFSSLPLLTWMESLDAKGLFNGQDIYTISPDGTGLSRLTNDLHSATPRWTPDGSGILFTRLGANATGTENRTEFWLMGRDGSDPYAVTNFNGCCPYYGDIQPSPSP